jgi:4-hydroxy-3-methylbut-2-enyl diphosphate reductase
VLIPAFGTTLEIEAILTKKGIDIVTYNTTCPFVEKVWNRSQKLGDNAHTIVIHGKHDHEETRATFSHSQSNAPSLVIKNMDEAILLGKIISGDVQMDKFYTSFEGKFSEGFDPLIHLTKFGVVNQTTMLATETQSITDYLRQIMVIKYGEENIQDHMADTRDTLCYATNDNQSSTYALMESNLDLAIVVGGFNSSNTTHLVEILENTCPTFFINGEHHIINETEIHTYNIHQNILEQHHDFLPNHRPLRIGITSGASCPDAIVDKVLMKLLNLLDEAPNLEQALKDIL